MSRQQRRKAHVCLPLHDAAPTDEAMAAEQIPNLRERVRFTPSVREDEGWPSGKAPAFEAGIIAGSNPAPSIRGCVAGYGLPLQGSAAGFDSLHLHQEETFSITPYELICTLSKGCFRGIRDAHLLDPVHIDRSRESGRADVCIQAGNREQLHRPPGSYPGGYLVGGTSQIQAGSRRPPRETQAAFVVFDLENAAARAFDVTGHGPSKARVCLRSVTG
jgi:hypothetical protein